MAEASLDLILEHQKRTLLELRGIRDELRTVRDDMSVLLGRQDIVERKLELVRDELAALAREVHGGRMRDRRLEERLERLEDEPVR